MNVLFLTLYPEHSASARYRVHQFLPYLEAQGVRTTVRCAIPEKWYPKLAGPDRILPGSVYQVVEFCQRLWQTAKLDAFDVVVVQKALSTIYIKGMESRLESARKLVLDVDDAVHLQSPHSSRVWDSVSDPNQVSAMMQQADRVLAGNRWLAEEVEKVGGTPEHFPTVVDTNRFLPLDNPPDGFVIGWIGGASTTPALETLSAVLNDLATDEILLVGADADALSIRNANVIPWDLGTEVAQLQRFALGVMPLEGTDWDRGKCALKALQYMACGVPCVATPFGAVTDIMEDNVHGLFAQSDAEWRAAFDALRDSEYRRTLGAAARKHVEDHYSLEVAALRLLEILESVV